MEVTPEHFVKVHEEKFLRPECRCTVPNNAHYKSHHIKVRKDILADTRYNTHHVLSARDSSSLSHAN